MFKQIDFTKTGGLYVYQETLDYLQTTYSQALAAISKNYGNMVIITGLTNNGAGNVTDGWVCLNGELIPVVGGNVQPYLHLENLVTNEQFDDGQQKPVYAAKRMLFASVANSNYVFADFKRLPLTGAEGTIYEALDAIQTVFNSVLFESAVILSGCTVTNVNTGASTCNISGGRAFMGGSMVYVGARNGGTYPCWLKPDGSYVTADPGGISIKFDYETSQRYKDVVKRNTHGIGEIVMSRSTADLAMFDVATGLGKWKWLGWKICDVMQSRVPLGYDRRSSQPAGADNEAWDNNNRALDNYGGEKKHQLTANELPKFKLKVNLPGNGEGEGGISFHDTNSNTGKYVYTEEIGNDEKHENRMPYRVILFIERI